MSIFEHDDDLAAAAAAFTQGGTRNKKGRRVAPAVGLPRQPQPVSMQAGVITRIHGDARKIPLEDGSVDLIVTSPPYWKKRDYGFPEQIGQEATPDLFIEQLLVAMDEWRRLLRKTGSIFLNVGDTYWRKSLAGVPAILEVEARRKGWILRNRIIWSKEGGIPDPSKNRLTNRYEHVFHFTVGHEYYYDLMGYSEIFGNGANPGDVWTIGKARKLNDHLAPYPDDLVKRAVALACPQEVCTKCGAPRERLFRRTAELDETRPQAKRAMEIAKASGLTPAHIAAIQATGISDAGKALRIQSGTGKNAGHVKALAAEAKAALGGYFREFTFAKKETTGWSKCRCKAAFRPGVVLDPFMGSGTTLNVAAEMGRIAVGVDLAPRSHNEVWGGHK